MRSMLRIEFNFLMLTTLILLTGCGPRSAVVKSDAVTADLSGLVLDSSQAPTLVYIRPGAPSLAAYSRFIIDPVRVNYTDPKMKELDPEDVGEMQQYFRNALIKELRAGGYEVGTRSQADTLRISLTVSGLKAPTAVGNVVSAVVPFSVSVGEVTVEGVFREALGNRIDAVVIDRAQGSRALNPTPWSTWLDIADSFDYWAKGIRESVDKAHGR